MEKVEKMRGITLIALVVTVILLLILAGVSIQLISGSNGILSRASQALDANDKAMATEKMELKITYLNMISYGENTRKATLQELADGLFADKEVEYVKLKNQEIATLEPIDVTGESSFFVKLREYSYEFEIDENLQLASVDGVKVENGNENYVSKSEFEELKTSISMLEKENEEWRNKLTSAQTETELLKNEMNNLSTIVSALQNKNTNKMQLIKRDVAVSEVSLTKNESTLLETVNLKGYGSGKAIISCSGYAPLSDGRFELSCYVDSKGVACDGDGMNDRVFNECGSFSAVVDYKENTKIEFFAYKYSTNTIVPIYTYSILLIPEE